MSARDPYFIEMQQALRTADVAEPALVIDLARLRANISKAQTLVPEGYAIRLVAKSLPSPELLALAMGSLGTDRLMTFHLPMLIALAQQFAQADQLIGKPLPVAAARQAIKTIGPAATARVQWLIDSPARLQQYAQLAEATGLLLRVNIEINIGLHRGGVTPGKDLASLLRQLNQTPQLQFSGLMGYEAHLSALPPLMGWQRRASLRSQALYRTAEAQARDVSGPETAQNGVFNIGGSSTFPAYSADSPGNEVAFGSALVKPSDFDKPLIAALEPAAFIAAPVLKVADDVQVPGFDRLHGFVRRVRAPRCKAVFTYGGKWMAGPVDPRGAMYSGLYGRSTNQELLMLPRDTQIAPDDFLFLRPQQSEVVLSQFGRIHLYDDGAITGTWSVFPAMG